MRLVSGCIGCHTLHGLQVPGLPAGPALLVQQSFAVNKVGCAVLDRLWLQARICEASREQL